MTKSIVGKWAKEKLDRLRRYLQEYTKIMRKQSHWCQGYYYIDAFAGPGQHKIREKSKSTLRNMFFEVADFSQSSAEQQQFLAGSPRVALDIEYPFTAYVFVERSPSRVAELKLLKSEYGDRRRILVRQMDCNKYLRDYVISNPKIDWEKNRAMVFLDPYGMQVPWSTLESLGKTKAIEVFLNLPVPMAIQRLLPRDPRKITQQRRAMLNEYFGSPDWFDIVYRKSRTLFGDESEAKVEQSGKRLMEWYRKRLKKAFGFVSNAALIRNSKGGHLYYLLLATPNKTGVKIANHILSAA